MKREFILLGLLLLSVVTLTISVSKCSGWKKKYNQTSNLPESGILPKHDTIWQDTGRTVTIVKYYQVVKHDTTKGDTIWVNLASNYSITDSLETDFVKTVYTANGYGYIESIDFKFNPRGIKHIIDSIPYPVDVPCAEKLLSVGLNAGIIGKGRVITQVDFTFKNHFGLDLIAMPFDRTWGAGIRYKIY